MSKRILKLNRTNDSSISNWVGESDPASVAAADTAATVHFHPLAGERLSESINENRHALAAATEDAVPAVLDVIERLQNFPDEIDPAVASRIGDMLHHALTAMKASVELDGAVDREGYNRLKTEMQDLQGRLLDALEQVRPTAR